MFDATVKSDIAKLKAELLRVEKERIDLMIRLIDACAPAPRPAQSYAVRYSVPAVTPAPAVAIVEPDKLFCPSKVTAKPSGLPTTASMVTAALQETTNLRPVEITAFIKKRWWPEMQAKATCATLAHMAKAGKVIGEGGRYRILNGRG